MPDLDAGSARPGVPAAGLVLAVPSAGTFGTSGIFASALISAGWSPAVATMAQLGGAAFLLTAPAVLQLRGRWRLLGREAGRVVLHGVVAIAGGQLCYFNADPVDPDRPGGAAGVYGCGAGGDRRSAVSGPGGSP